MNRRIAGLLLLLALSLMSISCQRRFLPAPLRGGPDVIGFLEQGWSDLTYSLPSLKKHYRDMQAVIPFWYTANADGGVVKSSGFDQEAHDFLKNNHQSKLLPLVNNASGKDSMFTDGDNRSRLIDELMWEFNDNKNYDGLTVDFELLPQGDKDQFTRFISDLSANVKKKGKQLAVAVFPQVDVSADVSGVYDYAKLSKLVDYFIVMTYDKHEETSDPGPVSPVDWVEANIKHALDAGVPPNKLVITVAAYGYDWPPDGNGEYLGLREILARAQQEGADIKWDDDSSSPYFTYEADDGEHTVWFDNGYAAAIRADLAKKYKIHGVAIWRIGFEDEDYWKQLLGAV